MSRYLQYISLTALVLPFSLLMGCERGGGGGDNGSELSSGEAKMLTESIAMLTTGDDGSKKSTNTDIDPSAFEGHYVQKCIGFDKSQSTMTITGDELVREKKWYADKECKEPKNPIQNSVITSSLDFVGGTTMTDHGESVNVDITSVSTSRNGKLSNSEPYTTEEIYLLDGNELYFGKKKDEFGERIEGRPTQIIRGLPFVKQE